VAQHYRGAGGTDSRGTQLVPCWAAVVGKLAAQWGSPLGWAGLLYLDGTVVSA